jgi:hypothetical protein
MAKSPADMTFHEWLEWSLRTHADELAAMARAEGHS